MRKEYTYSMPQAFIDDENVALKWRIYGYLNGFWISGKTFYARNDTIAKKFGSSERAIQYALKELERMGLCTRNIHGMKRIILPGGLPKGRSPASPLHETQLRAEGEAQLHHISDSISDRDIASVRSPKIKNKKGRMGKIHGYDESHSSDDYEPAIDADTREPVRRSSAKSGNANAKFWEIIKWAEGRRGSKFLASSIKKQFRALAEARANKITPAQIRERWLEMEEDKFWSKSGFDFMNVVLSFDKKPPKK